jgi:protein phosphatase
MPLAAVGVTHQGRRSTNEDSWLVDLNLGLLVVADGMGGHNAGEVASALAVETIHEVLRSTREPATAALLDQAVQQANDRILDAAQRPETSGMGTTVVAVLVTDGRVFYTSVGDSRIYLWHEGQLAQLTRDDSWLAEALEEESLAASQLGAHPMRHVLTKVVGLRSELKISTAECRLEPDDCLLLCSDGVHGTLPPDALATMLGSRRPVTEIAESVVRSAIARGATDNVTAIVARLSQ